MKKYDNIDDLFKNEVSDLKIQPSDEVWEAITSASIGKAGMGSNRTLLWGSIALLLLLGMFGIWYFRPATDVGMPAPGGDATPVLSKTEDILADPQPNQEKPIFSAEAVEIEVEETHTQHLDTEQIKFTDTQSFSPVSTAGTAVDKSVLMTPDTDEQSDASQINDLKFMPPRSIYQIGSIVPIGYLGHEDVVDIQTYMKKKKQFHLYTGVSALAAMMYYPNTKDQFTYSVDMALGYKLKRFYVETGLGYQTLKEQANYRIEFRSLDSIGYYHKVLSFQVNPANSNSITYKTKEVTVYDSIPHYSLASPTFSYEYLNIPLKLGYVFWENPSFRATIETGLIASKLLKSHISELDPADPENGKVTQVIRQTPDRVDLNMLWQIGLRIDYRLTPSVSLAAQPVFTTYLNGIYKDVKAGEQLKPYSMGVRMGIMYDF